MPVPVMAAKALTDIGKIPSIHKKHSENGF